MRRIILSAPLVFLLPLAGLAGTPAFLDWYQVNTPAYQALREASRQSGVSASDNWVVKRLQENQPVPQASARDLVMTLLENPKVGEETKKELREAFVSEVEQVEAEWGGLKGGADSLKGKLDEVQARLDEIKATLAKNNYFQQSTPRAILTLGGTAEDSEWSGLPTSHWAGFGRELWATFIGNLDHGKYTFNLGSTTDPGNNGYNKAPGLVSPGYSQPGFKSAVAASLFLDYPVFPNLTINIGGYTYLTWSNLIFSGGGYPYQSPFFLSYANVRPFAVEPVSGMRAVEGLYLRKQGQAGWWFFTDSQLLFQPDPGMYGPYETNRHMWEAAGRFDTRSLNFIPFTEDSFPYFTFDWANTDQAQLYGFNTAVLPPPDNNYRVFAVPEAARAFSLGLNSQLTGGGSLNLEWAHSYWQELNSAAPVAATDQTDQDDAWYLNFSKPVSLLTLGVICSQTGPNFITGYHADYASNNLQSGSTHDTSLADFRPGNQGKTAWMTLSNEPTWLVNNTRQVLLQGGRVAYWGSFTLLGGVSQQINPSGPWLRVAPYLSNNQNNGHDWYNIFNGGYSLTAPGTINSSFPSVGNYNAVTYAKSVGPAPALYNGKPVIFPGSLGINWQDLQQFDYENVWETVWLTQNGVGDQNLRAESIKYYNTLRASAQIDFQSIFSSAYPKTLWLYAEARDTAEQPEFPYGGSGGLLLQSFAGGDLKWDFGPIVEGLATCGYENRASNWCYYPVSCVDRIWGVGTNLLLSPILSNMVVTMIYHQLDHRDLALPGRSFSGWDVQVSTSMSIY